ncbi:MAG: universal stress protein [Nitrospiraceae bacterium]|nr:universal stress protein [Nitrospiraceae bacterium]
MGRYRKILVAVDGSESSRNALMQAFRLAVDEKCWITVTSVVPPVTGDLDLTAVKDVRSSLARPCEEALRDAARLAEQERVLIKTVREEGETYERIVDLADAENADIIVMGRRGLRQLERAMVGSVTARVIGHTQRDVLVVPKDATVGWKKVIVGTDGSRFSAVAVEKAISFAASYGGSLAVISVVDVPTELYAESPKAVEDLIRKAKADTAAVKSRAEASGVATETFVGEAEADEAILRLARDQAADVIVVGSHGRTGLRRLLMGSVTEKVIGSAVCPVLVVRS